MLKVTSILARLKMATGMRTDSELAGKLGVSLRRVQSWKQRNTIPCKEIIPFCLANDFDLNEILAGKKISPHKEDPCSTNDRMSGKTEKCPHLEFIIPPIGIISSKEILSDQVVDVFHICEGWIHYVLNMDSQHLALIRIVGNNMSPWAADGDVVFINTNQTTIVNDAPYILKYDGTLVAKRLSKMQTGEIIAKSDSPYCEPEVFSESNPLPQIIGRIVRRVVR